MTPIQTNKPVFFDDEGRVLEGGQIYIGQPSTDPRTNAKTVTFRDSGGAEFTASQPLNTVAGRISYNGKPIVALVDGEYSMLILDSAGKQIDYLRSVSAAGSESGGIANFSEVARVGLTLNDAKAFDVAVGEVVENVGKETATDNDGRRWLASSPTGSPANDVSLIDFNNGLQGVLVGSPVYFRTETVTLGGDFNDPDDKVKVSRVGNVVTISSAQFLLSTGSLSNPESSEGAIPAWARPSSGNVARNTFSYSSALSLTVSVEIGSSGLLSLVFLDQNIQPVASNTARGLNISYAI